MNKTVEELANAKINLALKIKTKRADGYHELESIMVPITLHDKLSFELLQSNTIIIDMSNGNIPLEKNIIYKTVILMKELYSINKGVKISVEKNIPVEAGLAGGSADCAATIRGLNNLFELDLSTENMLDIANRLGSDTAFCLLNKPALVSGRGDIIEKIECNFNHDFYIIKPDFGMSTAEIFRNHIITKSENNIDVIRKSILENDKDLLTSHWYNDLENTVNAISSDMNKLRDKLGIVSEETLMSGSGSSIIVFSKNEKQIENFAKDNSCKIFKTNVYR